MCEKLTSLVWDGDKGIEIQKWKVKKGMIISARQVIFHYIQAKVIGNAPFFKYKSPQAGTVCTIVAKENATVNPGDILLTLEECSHPTVMKDMCAECGADLRQDEPTNLKASVPMVHCVPELKVSEEQAQIIGKADETRLLNDRKLVLLVDLDQTLIHTTNDNISPDLKDVVHFQLYGSHSQWYHTRIRPGTQKFLESISTLFELHICTFGSRQYAHYIAMFLDPGGKFFSHRILSRDECFDPNSKTANLRALFPCGDRLVCIIDDREDVWNYAPNVIHVKPYHFFQHTGDINEPPGLAKNENSGDHLPLNNEKDKKSLKETKESGETTTDKDTEDEAESRKKTADKGDSKDNFTEGEKKIEDIKDNLMDHNNSDHKINSEIQDGLVEEVKINETLQENQQTNGSEAVVESKDNVMENIKELEKNVVNVENLTENETNVVENQIKENEKIEDTEMSEDSVKPTDDIDDKHNETIKVNSNESDAKNIHNERKDITQEINLIEVEDSDDYLLYLEDILRKIYTSYYEEYDKWKERKDDEDKLIPDLKTLIPEVKKKVLKGCCLVFSGLVPSHVPLKRSRAFLVAESLGAVVKDEVNAQCTHLVAARPGTAKVNSSRRFKGINIVTPEWLWHCAERWERVDERLYPLGRGVCTNRHPPAHCSSPQHQKPEPSLPVLNSNRSDSEKFSDTINPLLTFSSEDMQSMDKEVEDLCKDDEDDSESDEEMNISKLSKKTALFASVIPVEEPSSSSGESFTEDAPKGWSEKSMMKAARKRKIGETTTCTESEDFEEESPTVKFRRGEPLPSDLDLGEESQEDTLDSEGNVCDDDADWTLMGAALEREFLSGD